MLHWVQKRFGRFAFYVLNRGNIGKLTHAGGVGSNPRVPELWRLVTLKPLKLQQCTLHFWKPLIFFYLDKRGQECSCMLIYDMLSGIPIGLLHKMANECKHSHVIVALLYFLMEISLRNRIPPNSCQCILKICEHQIMVWKTVHLNRISRALDLRCNH